MGDRRMFGSPIATSPANVKRSVVVWYGVEQEKPWQGTPSPETGEEDGMAPAKEHRLSRGSIHPGGATPHIKDAFGPRMQNNSREWTGTPIPDSVSIPEFKSFDHSEGGGPPEDTSGGLPYLEKNLDRDNLFFKDGKRRIDLVMVYEEEDIDVGVLTEIETIRMETRRQFQKNLEKEGLELELEGKQDYSFVTPS